MRDTKWERILARKNRIKTCPYCGKQHTIQKKGDSRWCSEACFQQWLAEKHREDRQKEIAQALTVLKKYGILIEETA